MAIHNDRGRSALVWTAAQTAQERTRRYWMAWEAASVPERIRTSYAGRGGRFVEAHCMIGRVYRVTHPVIGVASWSEIWKAARKRRLETSSRICTWCFEPVPERGRRTKSCSHECAERIRMAYSWAWCRRITLKLYRCCELCGASGSLIEFQADHRIPVSLGGTGDPENLRKLCVPCHRAESRRLRALGAAFVALEPGAKEERRTV